MISGHRLYEMDMSTADTSLARVALATAPASTGGLTHQNTVCKCRRLHSVCLWACPSRTTGATDTQTADLSCKIKCEEAPMLLIKNGYMIDPKSGWDGNYDILVDGEKIIRIGK